MPKISKARIVNFNYNDGNRLIADELFDFSNEKDDDALNVLINLANGGGKSVMVQLMMQPVIPRGKVAGRKIESFFGKLSDHCFVALEWLKDNSKEKLLTGISMAAREIPSTEEETSGGMGIKYYTFYANYASDSSEYSLINLPFSRNESGRFLPAEYDSIKKLARKSNGQLNCYGSDDNPQWQKKLEEYGLYQDEWRMIEKLNSEEGGLGKFFGDFKTSNQLIDRLFIPTIEGKLKIAHSKEDSSLTTMLLSYARQYAGQKAKILEKGTYEAFLRAMELLKPLAETLGNRFYAQEEYTGRLFGLSAALQRAGSQCRDKRSEIEKALSEIDNQIRRIRWEEKSGEYYRCQEVFQEAEILWKTLQAETDRLQEELNRTTADLLTQECAEYYQQQIKHQNTILELKQAVSQKEQGLASSDEISLLGYSAACAIEEARTALQPNLAALQAKTEALSTQMDAVKQRIDDLQTKLNETQSAYDQQKGALSAAEAETDREAENLNADLSRRLDGSYAAQELDQLEQKIMADQEKQSQALERSGKALERTNTKLDNLPQEIANCCGEIREQAREKEKSTDELARYQEQEDKLRVISQEHTLDFSMRFTDSFMQYLHGLVQKSSAIYGDILRRISLAEEEVDAAKSGYLHVPKGVIEYLNSTGVLYSTCEKYLLNLVDVGRLSQEACLELLRKYPAAAYGILMDEAQNKKFFSFPREHWLPAMIPIFTPRQMEAILQNGSTHTGSIAFYSEAYFADREHYIAHLTHKQQELLNAKALEEHHRDHIQDQLDAVKAFSYTADWQPRQLKKIEASEKRLQELKEKQKTLEQQKQELLAKKQELTRKIEASREALRAAADRLSCIQHVRNRLETELNLVHQIELCKRKLSDYRQQNSDELHCLEAMQHDWADLQYQIEDGNRQLEQLEAAYEEVQDRHAEERLPGTWEALMQRYQTCLQTKNTELNDLRRQLKSEQEQEKKCHREIQKRNLPEEAYLNTSYSEALENSLRQKKQVLEHSMPGQYQLKEKASNEMGQAKGHLQSVQKELAEFGEALEKSQIGSDFSGRIQACQAEKSRNDAEARACEKEQHVLDREQIKLANYLAGFQIPAHIPEVKLEDNYINQCAQALSSHRQGEKELQQAEKEVTVQLDQMHREAPDEPSVIRQAISAMSALLSNETRGDRYFTLSIQIDSQMKNTALAIAQISTDLKEFENARTDLIRQCTLQGGRLYDGLRQMESSSRVTVYAGKPKQRMIQFDFPDHLDPAVSEAAIADELDQGTRELAEKLTDSTVTDTDRKRYAETIVGSKNLLRKFLGKESIQVKAFKIDQNPENSGYRKWKDTQINNSGAEKFVVYFAVILSLINYTRGSIGGIQDKELRSVLILDNPFGATSSKHILMPMFSIAKHFRVQMICLSDINKMDVIKCFDIVIKALVKKRPMSNREILTHEGNEQMEHGFYRAQQMSLL